MNTLEIKTCLRLTVIILFLGVAFTIQDEASSQVFASLGVIIGAYTSQRLLKQQTKGAEKQAKYKSN